ATENELDRAIEIIDGLVARGFEDLTAGEDAYLDVLSDLVEKYEKEHHPIPEASALEVLQFLMEDRNLNQRALALGAGIAVSTMSDIMACRRKINLDHMKKLAQFLQVSPAVFMPSGAAQTVKPKHRADIAALAEVAKTPARTRTRLTFPN